MSIVNTLALESNRQIKINFYGGDLSSDAGLLLIKEFISKLGIDTLLEKAFKTNAPVFKSVLEKDALASQPTVSRFFNRMDKDTLNQFLAIARVLRRKIYSVQMPQAVILDLDSTLLDAYGRQQPDFVSLYPYLSSHNNLCFSLVNSLFLTFSFLHRDIF